MTDKAGQKYWDTNWDRNTSPRFDPSSRTVRHYNHRQTAALLEETLGDLATGSTVAEIGCADSAILPYVASVGFEVAGIDYSPIGCGKIESRLRDAGVRAEITCCDVFDPPRRLLASFDALMSFGLVEHFTDTVEIVNAISTLAKPGGSILTVIPNMNGSVGALQRLTSPKVYDVHKALSPDELASAHRASGLQIVGSGYLLPVGFGVVNYEDATSRATYLLRRMLVRSLARMSWAFWAVDEKLFRLPRTSLLSPYCYCIAKTPAA